MRALFPDIAANFSELLDVGDGHRIYIEESGNPNGIPVVYCHGGPGGGGKTIFRRFYDPQVYRIIQFDQRGCGRSEPHCADDINALWQNTAQALVADMELIRQHLNIATWLVTGGSWGATLALLYAISHPERVSGLIVRGTFLARRQDLEWLFSAQGGASQIYPDFYREFIEGRDTTDLPSLFEDYYQQLIGDNDIAQLAAAKQFYQWESRIASIQAHTDHNEPPSRDMIAAATLNTHYFVNDCFLYESQILSQINNISTIPGFIIHGRHDMVCKLQGAHQLAEYWPNGRLEIVPSAGHTALDPFMVDALLRANDDMARFISSGAEV